MDTEKDDFQINQDVNGSISASFTPNKITSFDSMEKDNEESHQQSLEFDDASESREKTEELNKSENGEKFKPTSTSTPGDKSSNDNAYFEKIPSIKRQFYAGSADAGTDSLEEAGPGSESSYPDAESDINCRPFQVRSNTSLSSLMVPGSVRVPILGHETIEARARFTVYKIHVMLESNEMGWFIFRRYSDFAHLNNQLRVVFPNVRLSLPPKRWFRDNFDPDFLEDRQLGLQAFLDNITGHRDICMSQPVRDFFCFDDPPGPHDSLEESRATCESLEETIYELKSALTEKQDELELVKEELDLYKGHVQLLTGRLSELNKMSESDKTDLRSRIADSRLGSTKFDIDSLFGSGSTLLSPKPIRKTLSMEKIKEKEESEISQ